MQNLNVIILAAGNSTRLKSNTTKVMHPICGMPMLEHVVNTAQKLKPQKICVVVGHQQEQIQNYFSDRPQIIFAPQAKRLGTGHAVQIGYQKLKNPKGKVLVLNGDVPLIQSSTIKRLLKSQKNAPVSLMTAYLTNPFGYGRILRSEQGDVEKIVEEKNATLAQKDINEVNAGIYLFDAAFLKQSLPKIKKNPIKKEYYLTDLVALATRQNKNVIPFALEDSREILGANTRAELAFLNKIRRDQILNRHMDAGVGMEDPDTAFVDESVKIAADSFLGSQVHLFGTTKIGSGVHIETGCVLKNCIVKDQVRINAYSYLENCEIRANAVIGPFARIRPNSLVEENAKVGNFVELKKTKLGKGSKANHLSYLGDSIIGQNVNIGAGTITCNYDGKNKYPTQIEDDVFVGSDVQFIAPIKVGKKSYVAAGTTVTKDVPKESLAIARSPQKNILGYTLRRKKL